MVNFFKKIIRLEKKDTQTSDQRLHPKGYRSTAAAHPPQGDILPDTELASPDIQAESAGAFSREKAKADLERRIAEKLSRMSETDLEELFNLHEQQLKAKKKLERSTVNRHEPFIDGQISFAIQGDPQTSVQALSGEEAVIFADGASIIDEAAVFADGAYISDEPVTETVTAASDVNQSVPLVAPVMDTTPVTEPTPAASGTSFAVTGTAPVATATPYTIFADGVSLNDEPVAENVPAISDATLHVTDIAAAADADSASAAPVASEATAAETRLEKISGKLDHITDQTVQALEKIGRVCGAAADVCSSKIEKVSGVITQKSKLFFHAIAARFPSLPRVPSLSSPNYEQKKTRALKYRLLNFKRRIVKHEKKASSHMADFIVRIDDRNDVIAEKTVRMILRGNRSFNFARDWAELHKKKLLTGLVLLISVAITTVAVINHFTAYVYAYNGRTLGLVKNQEDVLRILEVVSEQLTREYGTEIDINKGEDITFERTFNTRKGTIDDMQEVFNRLTYMQDMNAKAYALYIDNKRIAILENEERANELLDGFRDIHLKNPDEADVVYENISFAEKVEVKPIDTQLGKIDKPEDVFSKMLTGAVAQKVHIVQKGETFSGIAKMYGMSQADLEASNPDVTPAKLKIEQQLVLTQAVPLLTVQTVEVATYPDIIPYETIYEDNPKVFKGEQTTKVKGVNGEREVTARITRNNGIEVAREELSAKIIRDASSAVVSRGTKDPPPLQGTGKFIVPVSGYRLTSKFGMRSGRMHNGIDMACKTGTRISASDGGTVTFAGYKNSLGYLVIINHGGNKETYYGHCSKLFVKQGDKVYQGQHIANVGNTGRSTGPHLHFEVHVSGVPKNPLSYI